MFSKIRKHVCAYEKFRKIRSHFRENIIKIRAAKTVTTWLKVLHLVVGGVIGLIAFVIAFLLNVIEVLVPIHLVEDDIVLFFELHLDEI